VYDGKPLCRVCIFDTVQFGLTVESPDDAHKFARQIIEFSHIFTYTYMFIILVSVVSIMCRLWGDTL